MDWTDHANHLLENLQPLVRVNRGGKKVTIKYDDATFEELCDASTLVFDSPLRRNSYGERANCRNCGAPATFDFQCAYCKTRY